MFKKKKRAVVILFIVAGLILSSIAFPLLPGLAAVKKQLSICKTFDLSFRPSTASWHKRIGPDLYFYLGSVKSRSSGTLVYPLFVTKEGTLWHAFCPGTANGQFKPLIESEGEQVEQWFAPTGSYYGQIKQYTVISLGALYLSAHHAELAEVRDSLGTEPLLLSCKSVGLDEHDGLWASFSDGLAYSQVQSLKGGRMGGFGCLFVVENMPDDYELTVGDLVLTKEDLMVP